MEIGGEVKLEEEDGGKRERNFLSAMKTKADRETSQGKRYAFIPNRRGRRAAGKQVEGCQD